MTHDATFLTCAQPDSCWPLWLKTLYVEVREIQLSAKENDMISTGDKLPEGALLRMTDKGPETVLLSSLTDNKKTVLVAVPGPFSSLCDKVHLPSFIRTKDQFDEQGVDHIVCVAVIDPFVMTSWGETTGATKAGITLLADADGAFTKAIGMNFDAPIVGFYGRSLRYAMLVEDGTVKILNMEKENGVCDLTAGEGLLEAM
jgi:glutaredoxin/glutathione-dependent peroxiredoxin